MQVSSHKMNKLQYEMYSMENIVANIVITVHDGQMVIRSLPIVGIIFQCIELLNYYVVYWELA